MLPMAAMKTGMVLPPCDDAGGHQHGNSDEDVSEHCEVLAEARQWQADRGVPNGHVEVTEAAAAAQCIGCINATLKADGFIAGKAASLVALFALIGRVELGFSAFLVHELA